MAHDPGMSDDAIKAATGRDWAQWRAMLDAGGAAGLPHAQIVGQVAQAGIGPWWRQMVAVGYERMTGMRAPGQRRDGAFAANASRTVAGDKDRALAQWLAVIDGVADFDGVFAVSEPRQSASAKWRYWRIDLDDGSKVAVGIADKPGGKAVIGVSHEKLADAAAAARASAWWKALLASLS